MCVCARNCAGLSLTIQFFTLLTIRFLQTGQADNSYLLRINEHKPSDRHKILYCTPKAQWEICTSIPRQKSLLYNRITETIINTVLLTDLVLDFINTSCTSLGLVTYRVDKPLAVSQSYQFFFFFKHRSGKSLQFK